MIQNQDPLTGDLLCVIESMKDSPDDLQGRRIFLTGGTGFFGRWLLESISLANDRLGLNTELVVLTRNAAAARSSLSCLAERPDIELLQGDIRSFAFPKGEYDYVIHAAAESSAKIANSDVLTLFDILVNGTRHVLDFAHACNAKSLLLTSSGAVYGPQAMNVSHLSENHPCIYPTSDLPDFNSAYRTGKRAAELLTAIYAQRYGIQAKIARCFAFVGPHLPLDQNFAIGNFILDGLAGGPIVVKGDGTPYRSYLYAADLASWLWTILLRGQSCQPYNVGSEDVITIKDLAQKVAESFSPVPEVVVMKTPHLNNPPERYIPSTRLARETLGLQQTVPLEVAISKTVTWHQSMKK